MNFQEWLDSKWGGSTVERRLKNFWLLNGQKLDFNPETFGRFTIGALRDFAYFRGVMDGLLLAESHGHDPVLDGSHPARGSHAECYELLSEKWRRELAEDAK